MAPCKEQRRYRIRRVAIIVDDQHPLRLPRFKWRRSVASPAYRRFLRQRRKPDHEFAAAAPSFAQCNNVSAMQRDQPLHQGQANTQTTFGAIERALALDEEIEHPGDQVGTDADSRILYAHDGQVGLPRDLHFDPATIRRVLDCIVEEVQYYLRKTSQIAV